MPTRIIGASDRFVNLFTKYGRNRNHLFNELERKGMEHIVERKLDNNSRVILAYKDRYAKRCSYAFKVNPDLSLEQKTYFPIKIMLPRKTCKRIDKIFADTNGNRIKQNTKSVTYINNKPIGEENITIKGSRLKRVAASEYANIEPRYTNVKESDNYVKCVENIKGKDSYTFLEHVDGSRTYIKNIGGQNYFFTTRK